MSFETIILERPVPHVAVVRLNRQDKHNAINARMSQELVQCLEILEADDDVRVLVLAGAGKKAFCAGADMAEVVPLLDDPPAGVSTSRQSSSHGGEAGRDAAAQAAYRLARVRKPVIAAVNGYAYGGGAVFAAACDIRICSQNARFRFPGASYGLVVGASQLPRIVGAPMAKELLFTARTIDADEALRIGLANRVVPLDDLERAVLEMATAIAENSPAAVIGSKEVVDVATSSRDAAKRELEINIELRGSQDHRERFRAAAERVVRQDR